MTAPSISATLHEALVKHCLIAPRICTLLVVRPIPLCRPVARAHTSSWRRPGVPQSREGPDIGCKPREREHRSSNGKGMMHPSPICNILAPYASPLRATTRPCVVRSPVTIHVDDRSSSTACRSRAAQARPIPVAWSVVRLVGERSRAPYARFGRPRIACPTPASGSGLRCGRRPHPIGAVSLSR